MSNEKMIYEKKPFPSKYFLIGLVTLLIGIVLCGLSFATNAQRTYFDLIIVLLAVLSVGFGAMFLLALEYIVGADWSVPFRRVTEITATVILIAPLVALPLLLNLNQMFVWLNPQIILDEYVAKKIPYLNQNFFIIRTLVIFALMFVFYFLFVVRSFKQDNNPNPNATKLSAKISAIFMPIFAISITVSSLDWVMSLHPKWFSTIFGVYYFAGSVLTALAVITFISLHLKEKGFLSNKLNEDHYYNFGALMFAFVNFWSYIAFSQFLLIWYANIPDETLWYMDRSKDGWMVISIGLIFIKFVIPYFALLSKPSKSDPTRLKIVSIWLIIANFYDLYFLIMPEYGKLAGVKGPMFSWNEIAIPFLFIGLITVVFALVAKNRNLMAIGDPKIKKGLEFHL